MSAKDCIANQYGNSFFYGMDGFCYHFSHLYYFLEVTTQGETDLSESSLIWEPPEEHLGVGEVPSGLCGWIAAAVVASTIVPFSEGLFTQQQIWKLHNRVEFPYLECGNL